ncbi:MAG: glutamine synthetase III [Clostridiales Family XIII bacterium]|jgi:glutamine synthetase|nr:glutamine synthetase III [Clostridiales Family XIII bacterium]
MFNMNTDFGSMVFNDAVMRDRLPKEIYESLNKTMLTRVPLDINVANVVANAMKNWAVEKGVTHFTHWFQPMTGVTAEKHEAFISIEPNGGVIMEFSGKELFRGEPDASSFPTGGIRATFEARGYTAWDPTSYAFIKGNVLCIPTAFCSYSGEALDKKTPLLRSMQAISREGRRLLKLFGEADDVDVLANVGAEQEYFLIDQSMYDKRPDLIYCGRTLFGARPPKGQDLEDHYFGAIKPRVAAYMSELDETLWTLGIASKTKHNEVAPAQHELAPIYESVNIATDHNQLTMELMKIIAPNHGLTCLLHEKPFAGVNGSGKHNNWSIATSTGENLLDPGSTPYENARFLLFLCAVIKAVDEHQDLLRISVATAANDHRLGANEAPPAIISVFLGEELTDILETIKRGAEYEQKEETQMEIGVDVLPVFPKDTTDRNRTSPFAFTGNKFEFRMVGSSLSIAGPNFILNTIVADALSQFADELEKADDFLAAVDALVKRTIVEHERIIFNGNNYSEEWVAEAEKRGLLNLAAVADALPLFTMDKNIKLFEKHGVLMRSEVVSRAELLMENYVKTIHIEALTMIDLVHRMIIPAVVDYTGKVLDSLHKKKNMNISLSLDTSLEAKLAERLSGLSGTLQRDLDRLEEAVMQAARCSGATESARYYGTEVFYSMQSLRGSVDELETIVGGNDWPLPTYGEILYSVK